MRTSESGRSLIEAFEGLFLKAYHDSVGVITIGYGHTNLAGVPPTVTPGMTISRDQADEILEADLAAVENNIPKCIKVPLAQYEFDALVSFEFNTGSLSHSSIKDKINSGNKTAAMLTLLLYNHARDRATGEQKEIAGLTRRRQAEKLMFEGKVTQALALAGAHLLPPPDIPAPEPKPVNFWTALLRFILSLFRKGN